MCVPVLLNVIFLSSYVSGFCSTLPCSRNDERCLEVLFNGILYSVIEGLPALDIQPSDPLFLDYIGEKFATLDFDAYNNTVFGLRNIRASEVLISDDLNMLSLMIESPSLRMNSTLDLNGYLMTLPVSGKRQSTSYFGQQTVIIYSTLYRFESADGDMFIQFGNFSLDIQLLGDFSVVYDSEEHTQEEIQEANDFVSKNGKKIFYFVKNVLWYPVVAAVLGNINKYFASVPLDKFICD